MEFSQIGKILIFVGVAFVLFGSLFFFQDKLPFLKGIGRLPGDIYIKRDGFHFYFPITTSILVSVILTLLLWLLSSRGSR